MKPILKLKPTVYQLIKYKIKNIIFRLFKKPYQDYIQKRQERKKTKEFKKEFIRNFGISPSHVVNLINRTNDILALRSIPTIKMSEDEYRVFLLEELKKNATEINKVKRYVKASLFYEPEIIDIHNESLSDNKGPTLKELLVLDDVDVKHKLWKQETNKDNKNW